MNVFELMGRELKKTREERLHDIARDSISNEPDETLETLIAELTEAYENELQFRESCIRAAHDANRFNEIASRSHSSSAT
jgi:hypothetical protein